MQRTTGSATAVGLLLFAQAIPPLAAPFAGVVADRFAPGRLLAAGWLAQAVLAGLLALLLPPLGALLAAVFALALVDTPLSAAAGRCIPAVVADDDLVAANALRSGVRELAAVPDPPLAGLLFAASGVRLVLGLDALTFLIVVPLALRLPAPPPGTGIRPRPSLARGAWRSPWRIPTSRPACSAPHHPGCLAGSWPTSTAEWASRQPPATSSAAPWWMPPPRAQLS